MQVSFSGIIKTRIPSENTFGIPINNKYAHVKELENVLNGKPSKDYTDSEAKKLIYTAKKIYPDYKFPKENEDDKNAGIYRIPARDYIYYCTGNDIELAKEKQKEIKQKGLKGTQARDEMQKFIDTRKDKTPSGFLMMEHEKGERYNIIGMYSYSPDMPDKNFDCEFLYF